VPQEPEHREQMSTREAGSGPPGNQTFIVLGRYTQECLTMLLDPGHDERSHVLAIAGKLGIDADAVDVWFATGDFDVVIRLGDATPRVALAFALAFSDGGVQTTTLAVYNDLGAVAADAAYARTQRGGEQARTQRGGDRARTQRGDEG
jgi:uncharacterized protein with GYD domain